jgi:hypothetical protein
VAGRRDDRPVLGEDDGVHDDPVPVLGREGGPQPPGGRLGPVPCDHPDHLPGVGVEGYPHPPHVPLVAHETPQFVGLDYEPAGLF